MSTKPTGRPSLLKPRAYARWWLADVKSAWVDGMKDVEGAKIRRHIAKQRLEAFKVANADLLKRR